VRSFIYKQPKLALGVNIAIAVMASGKAGAGVLASGTLPVVPQVGSWLPQGVVRKMLSGERSRFSINKVLELRPMSKSIACDDVNTTPSAVNEPMSYQQARLWLQSYNAGPYAVLKYKGNVPYRETCNYVPRVMKYYGEKLDTTPYDEYIVDSARKYGLDPQLIRAVMKAESDFHVKTVSGAGARGLMQVMPCVWSHVQEKYHLPWSYTAGVFEPQKNIEVACAYLAWLRYDFLPRHFANFEVSSDAPVAVVRDRGVPSRKTPRISVQAQPVSAAAAYLQAVAQLRNVSATPEEKAARSAASIIGNLGWDALSTSINTTSQERVATKVSGLKDTATATLQRVEVIMSSQKPKKKRGDRAMLRTRKANRRNT